MPKAKVVTYSRNRKTGKMKVTSKTIVKGKGADVNTAMTARGQNQAKTKGQLASQHEQNRHTEEMAKIANRAATVQSAIGQGTLTARNLVSNLNRPIQTNVTTTNPASVQSLVDGGASQSSNNRDEDEDEDGYANIA